MILDATRVWPEGELVWAGESVDATKGVVDAYNAQSDVPAPAVRSLRLLRPSPWRPSLRCRKPTNSPETATPERHEKFPRTANHAVRFFLCRYRNFERAMRCPIGLARRRTSQCSPSPKTPLCRIRARMGYARFLVLQATVLTVALLVPLLQPGLLPRLDLTHHLVPLFLSPAVTPSAPRQSVGKPSVDPLISILTVPRWIPRTTDPDRNSRAGRGCSMRPVCSGNRPWDRNPRRS